MADLIRYDLLVQDALRGVVRQVLTEVARHGLQGEHHFFVTFKTATPGLRLSNRMRERYPDEMTIILQHQFWGLNVQDAGFEVGLSFHNTPERLYVPFAAITMFQDPSVNFGLKFDVREPGAALPEPADAPGQPAKAEKRRGLVPVETPAQLPAKSSEPKPAELKVAEKAKLVVARDNEAAAESDKAASDDKAAPKVVSIDAFRKKP